MLLWDVANAAVLRRWEGHGGRCNAVAWGGREDEGGVVVSGVLPCNVQVLGMQFWC